jgi:hypothetical protein
MMVIALMAAMTEIPVMAVLAMSFAAFGVCIGSADLSVDD